MLQNHNRILKNSSKKRITKAGLRSRPTRILTFLNVREIISQKVYTTAKYQWGREWMKRRKRWWREGRSGREREKQGGIFDHHGIFVSYLKVKEPYKSVSSFFGLFPYYLFAFKGVNGINIPWLYFLATSCALNSPPLTSLQSPPLTDICLKPFSSMYFPCVPLPLLSCQNNLLKPQT